MKVAITGRGGVARGILAAVLGSLIYRVIIAAALVSDVGAQNFKLVSAVIVAAAISWPAIREKLPDQVDLAFVNGGQPVYYLIISVE